MLISQPELLRNKIGFFLDNISDGVYCYEFQPPMDLNQPVDVLWAGTLNGVLMQSNSAHAAILGSGKTSQTVQGALTGEVLVDSEHNRTVFTAFFKTRIVSKFITVEFHVGPTETLWVNVQHRVEIQDGHLVRVWGVWNEVPQVAHDSAARRAHEGALVNLEKVALSGLCEMLALSSGDSSSHVARTKRYIQVLGLELSNTPLFHKKLDAVTIDSISNASVLHDIGMVGLPKNSYSKTCDMTQKEIEVMESHTIRGVKHLRKLENTLNVEGSYLGVAREMAHSHHEHWDGSGYPQGLVGQTIPLSARILGIVDAFDSLIFHRAYGGAIPPELAIELIRAESGRHFDPLIVDAFLKVADSMLEIANDLPERGVQ